MTSTEKDIRLSIIAGGVTLETTGLNVGTAGNISVRIGDSLLITPSAVPYQLMRPEHIAKMPINGEYGAWAGPLKPSTEWRFHLDIMRLRPDVGAVVHMHPTFGCALAMLHKPILATHYMIALFGGPVIKCTKYAPFGTKELAELVVESLEDRHAVLLGNHGALVTGPDLPTAMNRAKELENLARMYYYAIAAGKPVVLSDEEIQRNIERFKTYGGGTDAPKLKAAPKKQAAKRKAAPAKKKATGPKKKARTRS